jgi:c-di-GMP-binding flagellar brake protein YcgR
MASSYIPTHLDMPAMGDRRQNERYPVEKGCKLFHWPTRKYLSAKMCDISRGGAMLKVETPRSMLTDEDVDVLISWDDRALVRSADEVSARVVRSFETSSGDRMVAVEFTRDVKQAAIAA